MKIIFEKVYNLLLKKRVARGIVPSEGTEYEVEAKFNKNNVRCMKISFEKVYNLLLKKGVAKGIVSSRGTEYEVEAKLNRNNVKCIIARPIKGGQFYIHEDCWGDNITCQKARAGGIYNGIYSIENWYNDNC